MKVQVTQISFVHYTLLGNENVTLLFFPWLSQKSTEYNDSWCTDVWENLTSEDYKIVNLSSELIPH